MKKTALFVLMLGLALASAAADRDVNRDGRVDQSDVTALARMVAGLDPIDTRFDQDGDGAVTLDDVNHLLDTIPPDQISGPPPTPAPHQTAAPPNSGGGMVFYAVRQQSTGRCVVVAGDEGLGPGDTVFGAHASYASAQDALVVQCSQASSTPIVINPPVAAALTNDRLYRPDDTITRGKWGTAQHIGSDAALKTGVNERGFDLRDGFLVAPGHGGDTEIVYRHDGSHLELSGTATVIDCLNYCGRAGSIVFTLRGDGRDLWSTGLIRQNDPPRPFSVSLDGIREVRLVANDGGNGVDEDWGGWLNLAIREPGSHVPPPTGGGGTTISTQTSNSPVIAIPRYDNDDSTKGIIVIDLKDGKAVLLNRLKRSPLDVRSISIPINIFSALGRSTSQPAEDGQVLAGPIRKSNGSVHALLLVDTTTGAMAYLTRLGDDPSKFRLKQIVNRPARAMADPDGNFTLAMRRDSSGETVAAYLYHGTSGRCMLFKGLGDMRPDLKPTPTTTLPATGGSVSSLELEGRNEATTGILLIDNEKGDLLFVSGVESKAAQLTHRKLRYNLVSAFPAHTPVATPRRFVAVPISSGSGATESALIIDVAGGTTAVLKNLTNPTKVTLDGLGRSIYPALSSDVAGERSISAVAKIGDRGATEGAWLFDSATEKRLFLSKVRDPDRLEIRPVGITKGR